MTITEFINTNKPPFTIYVVSCPGGYFRERTMNNTYLIGDLYEAGVITDKKLANLTAAMIGDDAKILTVKISK